MAIPIPTRQGLYNRLYDPKERAQLQTKLEGTQHLLRIVRDGMLPFRNFMLGEVRASDPITRKALVSIEHSMADCFDHAVGLFSKEGMVPVAKETSVLSKPVDEAVSQMGRLLTRAQVRLDKIEKQVKEGSTPDPNVQIAVANWVHRITSVATALATFSKIFREGASSSPIGGHIEGRVMDVLDADTVKIIPNHQAMTVRFDRVDAPEKNQPFGQEAKQFTYGLVGEGEVSVRVVEIDRYGRSVGEITLPDGRSLNRELVRLGYARHYVRFSSDPELEVLETKARENKLGLWQFPSVAPWLYRKMTPEAQEKVWEEFNNPPIPSA